LNKFLELPLPQRLLVVGVVLALVGGASYYLLISSVGDDISKEAKRYKTLMNDYAVLKEYDSAEFRERMEKERTEAAAKKSEYEKMLPRQAGIPDFISTLKADADATELVLARFEPVEELESGQGYHGVSFALEIVGSWQQLVRYLLAIAAPNKRIVNIKRLQIESHLPAETDALIAEVGVLRVLKERQRERQLTPAESQLMTMLMYEELSKHIQLRASFVATAYVYTGDGGAAPAAGGAK